MTIRTIRDHPHLPKSSGPGGILSISLEWFDGLPPSVRPINLIEQYPRIVNLIALEWNNAPVVGTLMSDLLKEDLGGEDGFPVVVFHELQTLHDHYFKAGLAQRLNFREFEALAAGLGTGK